MDITEKDRRRFWAKVDPATSGECWIWTGATREGYGRFSLRGSVDAHRFSYILANGEIPEGMQIDHTCFARPCVNPDHLRLVTQQQNLENQQGAYKNSKSGIRGVRWRARSKTWVVEVRCRGAYHRGGSYASLDDATQASLELRNQVFTHNFADR